jgi:threonine aldolase
MSINRPLVNTATGHSRSNQLLDKKWYYSSFNMAPITIDCRSDTVTVPSKGMRQAMAEAEVGDDVFREDPTVKKLEEKVASMLGKEAGLFVPSGTMGNLISIMAHCWGRGEEIILGDRSHIHVYEQGGVAQVYVIILD